MNGSIFYLGDYYKKGSKLAGNYLNKETESNYATNAYHEKTYEKYGNVQISAAVSYTHLTGLLTETNTDQTRTTSALYLEVGTWGSATDSAYKINNGAVALNIGNSKYFDELSGITRFDDAGNSNAVVSLAVRDSSGNAALIDKGSTTNTYTGQILSLIHI